MKKNMKLVAIIPAAALVATIGLAGCGSTQQSAPADTAPKTETAAPAETKQDTAATTDTKSNADATAKDNATTKAPAADTKATATAQGEYIGEEAAKKAALDHAGFAAGDVTELSAELDTDDDTVHYDVDFKNGGQEYDYDIDATTGAVITFHSEVDD